jgi:transcriptional regulator GlxA family with amidase domain
VIVAFDDAQALDLVGPAEVFAEANQFSDHSEYRITTIGTSTGLLRMSNGIQLSATHFSKWRGTIDTLIVAGGSQTALQTVANNTKFLSWLKGRALGSRRVASVCTGAFVLAELGLLDGRRVSTHWGACEQLKGYAPRVDVDPDAIFVKDGNVYTSAGVTCGIDLALSLVEEDLGRNICAQIARNLVLYLRRSGGQSQYSLPLQLQSTHSKGMSKVAEYIQDNLTADLSIGTLANLFGLSSRHFSRQFLAEVGQTPARYINKIRLDAARIHLESSDLRLKQIAAKCGYRSADTMGRTFRTNFGVTPDEYRTGFT